MRASVVAVVTIPVLLTGCGELPENFPTPGFYERSCLGGTRCQIEIKGGNLLNDPVAIFRIVNADGENAGDCGPFPPAAALASGDSGKSYVGIIRSTSVSTITVSRTDDSSIDVAFQGNWCAGNSGANIGGKGPRTPGMTPKEIEDRIYKRA